MVGRKCCMFDESRQNVDYECQRLTEKFARWMPKNLTVYHNSARTENMPRSPDSVLYRRKQSRLNDMEASPFATEEKFPTMLRCKNVLRNNWAQGRVLFSTQP
ncbi:hypothetical protein TNCV_4702751 [Trichonephila clavipes]|nr:hypothetical protein TNCV_4702751 [Trichonephila clavipes]